MNQNPTRSSRPDSSSLANRVIGPLFALRRGRRTFYVWHGLAVSIAVLLGAALLWSLTFLAGDGPPYGPAAIFWGFAFGLALIPLAIYSLPAIFLAPDLRRQAEAVEAGFPVLGGRLRAAVELEANFDPGGSTVLRDLNLKQVGTVLEGLDLRTLLPRAARDRSLRFATAALAAMLLVTLAAPLRFGAAVQGGIDFFSGTRPPGATRLVVHPGRATVVRSSDVEVLAAVVPVGAGAPQFWFSRPGTDARSFAMEPLDGPVGIYRYSIKSVLKPFDYYVTAADAVSDTFRIDLIEQPSITSLRIELRYPDYTGQAARRLEEQVGDVTAPRGTRVRLELGTDRAMRSAALVFDDSSRAILRVAGAGAAGSWRVERSGSYRIEVEGENGLANLDPVWYRVTSVSDESPFIQVLSPELGYQPGEDMTVPLSVSASDDWGIESLWLEYRRAGREEGGRLEPGPPAGSGRELIWRTGWDISPLGLRPGDVIDYRLAARDNDTVTGPKTTCTETRTIRLPTISALLDLAEKEMGEEVPHLSDVLKESARIGELFKEIGRDLSVREQLDWSRKEDLKGALSRQEELTRETLESLKKLDETMEKLERSGRMSLEIAEKMERLRQIMSEVLPPDILKRLEDLSRKVDEMSPEELSRGLADLRKQQEEFLERLDRTLALMKQLQQAQQMAALEQKMDELLEAQQDLLDSTRAGRTEDQLKGLSPEERELAQELRELGGKTASLADSLSGDSRETAEQLDRIAQEMSDGQTGRDMDAAGEHLERGERDPAAQREEAAAAGLRSMAENLSEAAAGMRQGTSAEMQQQIDRTATDLLGLSFEQESVNQGEGRSGAAQRQAAIGDAIQSAQRELAEAGKKSFLLDPEIKKQLDKAIENSRAAAEAQSQGESEQALGKGRSALMSLNQALESLFQLQDAMAQSSSAMGLEEALNKLESLAGAQEQLNRETMGLSGELGEGPDGFNLEERALMQRLARDQSLIRDRMEEVRKQMEERDRLLGDLGEIAREMDEVVSDLKDTGVSEETIERQNRILSRMLDASRSVNRRDLRPRRLSRTARPFDRLESPSGDRGAEPSGDSVWMEMARALDEDFPPEYEPLIRAYFRSLARLRENGAGDR